ncbi:hypothetical protein DC434_00225 [Microbacterium sp. TPD7012]|nr:hypothetical protein DC434_00225 [Microbacterium sp. TPD7012]
MTGSSPASQQFSRRRGGCRCRVRRCGPTRTTRLPLSPHAPSPRRRPRHRRHPSPLRRRPPGCRRRRAARRSPRLRAPRGAP